MRIAAGVLLILAFLLNGFAGFGYAIGGAAVGGLGQGVENASKQDKPADAANRQQSQQMETAGKTAKRTGGLIAVFGFSLVGLCLAQLVLAVFLLMDKDVGVFGWIVAVLGIAAELAGAMLTRFGVMNIPGLIASGLLMAWMVMAAREQQGTYNDLNRY